MDWLEDLGLGGEEKNIVDYLATLSASEQRTYLSSLLPETRHPFIEDIINHFHRGQTKKVTKESPSASSSVNKTCNESKSVLKFGKARALDDPHMKSSPKLTYITGNEEGISTSELKNCLECGMIYHFKAYNELSHCSFCENPLGKSQKKRAMNKSVSELEDLRAMELRDKLLQYDVTCAERTKVYDDHEDYYELDSSGKFCSQHEIRF